MQKIKLYNKSCLAVPMPTFQLKGTVSVTCAFSLESYVWYFTLNSGTIFHLLIGNHNHFCSVLLCFLYLWSALNCQIFKVQSCPDKGTTSVPALLGADLPQSESWLPSAANGLLQKDKSQFHNLHDNETPALCLFTPGWSSALTFIKMCAFCTEREKV